MKRAVSLLLAMMFALSVLPGGAFAADLPQNEEWFIEAASDTIIRTRVPTAEEVAAHGGVTYRLETLEYLSAEKKFNLRMPSGLRIGTFTLVVDYTYGTGTNEVDSGITFFGFVDVSILDGWVQSFGDSGDYQNRFSFQTSIDLYNPSSRLGLIANFTGYQAGRSMTLDCVQKDYAHLSLDD